MKLRFNDINGVSVTEVESPCRNMCEIDARSGLCRGCFRTLAEIAAWPGMTSEARRVLTERLAARSARAPDEE